MSVCQTPKAFAFVSLKYTGYVAYLCGQITQLDIYSDKRLVAQYCYGMCKYLYNIPTKKSLSSAQNQSNFHITIEGGPTELGLQYAKVYTELLSIGDAVERLPSLSGTIQIFV